MVTVVYFLWSIYLITAASAQIHFPLTFSSDSKYVLHIQMASKSFSMVLSTSTGNFILAGVDCTNCGNAPPLNTSDIPDFVPLSDSVRNVTVLGSSVSGRLVSHSCGLVTNNGSLWTYQNQTMIIANSSSGLPFSTQVSGIFGLGTAGYSGLLNDTVYGRWLSAHPDAKNFTFGMALNPPKDSGDAGVLHWLVPEPSAYTGSVSWLPTSPQTSSAPTSDLIVQTTEWDFSSTGIRMSNSRGVLAVIDPFHPEIRIPNASIQEMIADLNGVAVPGEDTIGWNLPCSTKMSFGVKLGALTFNVDEKTLIRQYANGTCYSLLVGWKDPSITTLLLGSSFISNTYLIFVVDRTGASNIGLAELARSTRLSKGVIGGMTAAIVLTFLVTLALIWFYIQKRSRTARIHQISRRYSSATKHQPSPSSAILMSPSDFHSSQQETELEALTPDSSNLPSSNLLPNSPMAEGTVHMTVEHTTENLGASRLYSGLPTGTLTPTEIISPTSTDIFAIEPFYIPPPPYIAPQRRRRSLRSAIMDIKSAAMRSPGRGDPSWPDTP